LLKFEGSVNVNIADTMHLLPENRRKEIFPEFVRFKNMDKWDFYFFKTLYDVRKNTPNNYAKMLDIVEKNFLKVEFKSEYMKRLEIAQTKTIDGKTKKI